MKKRYLADIISSHCFDSDKMAFVSGARQCGKTTLSKVILAKRESGKYLNWDDREFRRNWATDPKVLTSDLNYQARPLIVFDEIHKSRYWKRDLKGLYDTLIDPVDILVTGSARLSAFRKGGDSLFGRYLHYRLHPFSLRELFFTDELTPEQARTRLFNPDRATPEQEEYLEYLFTFSGFPEPLLAQNERTLNLWQRTRQERVIREDLRDLSRLPELSSIELLVALLPERVAAPIKKQRFVSLLETNHGTLKRWLTYLQELYYVYEVKPYFHDIKNSLRKEGKLYLWDYSEVTDPAARFENMVANHLLKACHYWTDLGFGTFELRYLRNKRGLEIDFLIVKDNKPWLPVEVKLSETEASPNWKHFLPQLKVLGGIQMINRKQHRRTVEIEGKPVLISGAADLLMQLI